MANGKEHNLKDGNWRNILVAVIGAIIGSSGTVGIFLGTPYGQQVARPDPFTGSQATALTERLGRIEADIYTHKLRHPDRALDLRLTLVESNYQHLTETLDRIEAKIDSK